MQRILQLAQFIPPLGHLDPFRGDSGDGGGDGDGDGGDGGNDGDDYHDALLAQGWTTKIHYDLQGDGYYHPKLLSLVRRYHTRCTV